MKIFIFSLLVCFALAASASEFEEDVTHGHGLKTEGNYTRATAYLAKVMSRARPGQYPGSGIIPGKSSKYWLKKCSPCWFAVENLLTKKSTNANSEDDDDLDDVTEEDEAKITPTGERKFSTTHCAKLMSRVKPGQLPGSGIAPRKSPTFWQKKCHPCWYAVKKLLKKKPTKPTTEGGDVDGENDDELDMDHLEEDETSRDPIKYFGRRRGYYGGGYYGGFYGLPYGGFYGLPYGGFYGRRYPGYIFG